MTNEQRRWVVLIRESGHWRVLASYAERSEAYRASSATRADGTPCRILRDGDPRINQLLLAEQRN